MIEAGDLWLWAPYGVFLVTTFFMTIILRCTRQGWITSLHLAAFVGTAGMLLVRGLKSNSECGETTMMDRVELATMIYVGTAVIIHYASLTFRYKSHRSCEEFFRCSRDEDLFTEAYPQYRKPQEGDSLV